VRWRMRPARILGTILPEALVHLDCTSGGVPGALHPAQATSGFGALTSGALGGSVGAALRPTDRLNNWYQPLRGYGAPGVHRRWRPGPCAHCKARSEICQLRAQGCRLRRCGLPAARACAPASGTPWGTSGGMAPTRCAGDLAQAARRPPAPPPVSRVIKKKRRRGARVWEYCSEFG
jgi:hypothetical protein